MGAVWVPGEPGLGRSPRAAREWRELVRAWWLEEGDGMRGGRVDVVIVHTAATPPSADRVARLVREATGAEVAEVRVRRSRWRDGVALVPARSA
jgi:hypothetical protein